MEETHRSFAHISGGQNSVVYRLSYRTPIFSTAVTIDVRYDTCLGIICELYRIAGSLLSDKYATRTRDYNFIYYPI